MKSWSRRRVYFLVRTNSVGFYPESMQNEFDNLIITAKEKFSSIPLRSNLALDDTITALFNRLYRDTLECIVVCKAYSGAVVGDSPYSYLEVT